MQQHNVEVRIQLCEVKILIFIGKITEYGPSHVMPIGRPISEWLNARHDMGPPRLPAYRNVPGEPRVSVPIMHNSLAMTVFPARFNHSVLSPGYQEAHSRFIEMRDHLQSQAYSVQKAQVIIVKVRMMTQLPGKLKQTPVSVSGPIVHLYGKDN